MKKDQILSKSSIYKYQIGQKVEYMPTDDSFYALAWYTVSIIQCGEKTIGLRRWPYYVIQWGPFDTTISVEEWQLRPILEPNEYRTLDVYENDIPAGTLIECCNEVNNIKAWFLGKVAQKTSKSSKNIQIEYFNQKWNNASQESKSSSNAPKYICRFPSQNDKTSQLVLEGKLPPRLLSDEEHLMTLFYDEFIRMKEECNNIDKLFAEDFERKREKAVDLIDSFVNARHYDSAIGVLMWMKEMERILN